MKKKILLTTLSKLTQIRQAVYYAKGDKEENNRYCTGVFSCEPGSKYILGNYDIDAIVVVGTDQTYNAELDNTFFENIKDGEAYRELKARAVDECRYNDKGMIDKTPSALCMYAFQMSAFLTGKKDYIAYDVQTLKWKEKNLKETAGSLKKYTKYKRYNTYSEIDENILQVSELKLRAEEKDYLVHWYYERKLEKFAEEDAQQLKEEWIKRNETVVWKKQVSDMLPGKKQLLATIGNSGEEKKISLRFIPEEIEDQDNIQGIVNAIRETARIAENNQYEDIKLYVDVQGGLRTSIFVRNAVLSILSSQQSNKVTVEEYVAVHFEDGKREHKIDSETRRYRIDKLVSGMNSFIRYGKADLLEEYCKEMVDMGSLTENSMVHKMVEQMVKIDHTLSVCDTKNFTKAFRKLSALLIEKNMQEKDERDSFVENVFDILKSGIVADYGTPLEGEKVDYLALIDWCRRKGFIQQALTLIEENMPTEFFRKGILKAEAKLPEDLDYVRIIDDNGMNVDIASANIMLHKNLLSQDDRAYVKRYSKVIVDALKKNYMEAVGETRIKNVTTIGKYGPRNNVNWILEKIFTTLGYDGFTNMNVAELVYAVEDRRGSAGRGTALFHVGDYCMSGEYRAGFESQLENLVTELKQKDGEEFLVAYCKFRSFMDDYSKEDEKLKLVRAEKFYWRAYEVLKATPVCVSLMFYLGEHLYRNRNLAAVNVKLSLHDTMEALPDNDRKRIILLLDKLFLLHDALQDERNNSNHASSDMRLDKTIIDKAIEIYVETFRSIISCIGSGNFEELKIFEKK